MQVCAENRRSKSWPRLDLSGSGDVGSPLLQFPSPGIRSPNTIIPRLTTIPHKALVRNFLLLNLDLLHKNDSHVSILPLIEHLEVFLEFRTETNLHILVNIFILDLQLDPTETAQVQKAIRDPLKVNVQKSTVQAQDINAWFKIDGSRCVDLALTVGADGAFDAEFQSPNPGP